MKFNFQVAVRRLVEYVHRSGDLTYFFSSQRRATESIRIHQMIQKKRSRHYQSEVSLSLLVDQSEFSLQVSGRMDGIYFNDLLPIVEEIKTTTADIDHLVKNENPIHWGQVKIYAYIWAYQNGLDSIGTQLVYYQMDTKVLRTSYQRFSMAELSIYFEDIINAYVSWAKKNAVWRSKRDRSIDTLAFPFDNFRDGQRDLSVSVYRALRDERQLMIQAATGIGKTLGVLFPSLKSIGKGYMDKFIYLTARTTGRFSAEEALHRLHKKGLKFRYISLTAKDKICFCPEKSCTPLECEFAKGHYDRLNKAVFSIFKEEEITKEVVTSYAREFKICPFEFSLDIALWADGIICDYNYAFDPKVSLKFLFEEEACKKIFFLIDESHNLVDRAREMFSAGVEKTEYLQLRRSVKRDIPSLYKVLGKINSQFLKEIKSSSGQSERSVSDAPQEFADCLKQFIRPAEKWLLLNKKTDFSDSLLEIYHNTLFFLKIAEQFDDTYITLYTGDKKEFSLRLFCMDPSNLLKVALARSKSAVFFSATLTPFDYFKSILGLNDTFQTTLVPSPFPMKNFKVLVAGFISTYYRDRDQTKISLAGLIAAFISKGRGNTLIFFPSYSYMHLIYNAYISFNGSEHTLVQTPNMKEEDRLLFLNRFKENNNYSTIGFAVMGGIFNEGVDLSGDQLSAVVVVGVGLPMVCLQRNVIRDYYQKKSKMGFEYAYQYPGLHKVFQSAGRVIRSESDKGVLLLIDKRFGSFDYGRNFPSHWQTVRITSDAVMEKELDNFWNR